MPYFVKVGALITAAVFLAVGVMFLLIVAFDYDAELLRSLKFVLPLVVGAGLVLAVIFLPRDKQKVKR